MASNHQPEFTMMPDVNSQPHPEKLLIDPPYHLVVYGGGKTSVEVQCSHSPTLEFLAEYLKKYCKANAQDVRRPPAVEIKLYKSMFGFGVSYERLTLSVEGRNPDNLVSPMIILSLVEGVLGYKSVSVDGSTWVFRRDIQFRQSR
ncbi:hypothetical protein F4821DRAFT_92506 [Hypoxylon rubiginosum]|uniref:Uncharacterized protein n=1 Tax=Hypoxylon rubiginosum TaxID=110542 RepID=A0ACC0D6A7_9PEZI|nr:hypothetical protein F4821DRAFT_92506 [Hypoxylon rubiginosum]